MTIANRDTDHSGASMKPDSMDGAKRQRSSSVAWRCLNMGLSVGLSVVLWCASSYSMAAEERLAFDDPAQQQLYRQLTAELRCPKCQNQNIADSNAVVAVDMRQKTYQLVQQGQDYQQVVDFMKQRYGDFVHYKPPVRLSTIWLWLLPALMVPALWLAVWWRRRQTDVALTRVDVTSQPTDVSTQQATARLDAIIAEMEKKS